MRKIMHILYKLCINLLHNGTPIMPHTIGKGQLVDKLIRVLFANMRITPFKRCESRMKQVERRSPQKSTLKTPRKVTYHVSLISHNVFKTIKFVFFVCVKFPMGNGKRI